MMRLIADTETGIRIKFTGHWIETRQVLATLERLAETQQNLPVPLTAQERLDLRDAFHLIKGYMAADGVR